MAGLPWAHAHSLAHRVHAEYERVSHLLGDVPSSHLPLRAAWHKRLSQELNLLGQLTPGLVNIVL